MGGVADEFVGVGHFGERDGVVAEEAEGDAAEVPRFIAAAEVFEEEIVLRQLVSEIVFHAGTTGHEGAPERGLTDVVQIVADGFAGFVEAGEALVAGVGGHALVGGVLFVVADDPRAAGGGGSADPLEGLLVRGLPAVLRGRTREEGLIAKERFVNFVLLGREAMDDDQVVIGIRVVNELRHVLLLCDGLRVLFAEVPIEREVVAEARDELAEVESALGAAGAAVERFGHAAGFGLGPDAVVVVFVFLELEMQKHAAGLRVVEDDAPLVETRAVVVELFVAGDEGPDVVAVAGGVVGEKGDPVDALRAEVVEGADESFALAALPRGIAGAPIAEVRCVGLEGNFFFEREGVVEVGVGEQGLRGIGAGLEEGLAGAGVDKVVAAVVGEATAGAEIGAVLIRRGDGKRAGQAVVGSEGRALAVGGGVGAGGEGDAVVPLACFVGRDVGAPRGTGGGGRIGSVAVGGEVAGHHVGRRAGLVGEGNVEAVTSKRIRRGVGLGGERAGEVDGDLVPLAEFAGDLHAGVAAGLAGHGAEEFFALSFCEVELGLAVAVVAGDGRRKRDFGPTAAARFLAVLGPDLRAHFDEGALADLDAVPSLVEAFALFDREVGRRAHEAPE